MANSIIIKCYQEKKNENYIITIDKSVFEMNNDANMPNGLNMYCGEILQLNSNQLKELQLGDLPKGTLIGIINRLLFDLNWYKDHSIKKLY
jgi:rRNA pseudouridine-1189 N-methylase Emg1 (Nep1/Mra1 family)